MQALRDLARRKRRAPIVGVFVLVVAVAIVGAGSAAGKAPQFTASGLTPDSTFSGAKSDSGQLAQTDPTLLGQSSSAPVNVMIKYDFDATASYKGDVAGLAATSPEVTGVPLTDNTAAVSAYDNYTSGVASDITAAVENAAPSVQVTQTFQTVYGGVQAQVPANSIGALLNVPGVAAVQRDTLNQPLDDNTSFIGATTVWPTLGGSTLAGSNVVVGVLDTGVWPESPFFVAKPGEPAPPRPLSAYHCDFGDGFDVGASRTGVRVQQQAHRRVQLHADLHGQCRLERPGVLQQRDGRVLGPRLRGSRHAHLVDRRGRLRHVGGALRRRAWPRLRDRTGRARDHVPRLPRAGLLLAPTRSRRCSRRSPTA